MAGAGHKPQGVLTFVRKQWWSGLFLSSTFCAILFWVFLFFETYISGSCLPNSGEAMKWCKAPRFFRSAEHGWTHDKARILRLMLVDSWICWISLFGIHFWIHGISSLDFVDELRVLDQQKGSIDSPTSLTCPAVCVSVLVGVVHMEWLGSRELGERQAQPLGLGCSELCSDHILATRGLEQICWTSVSWIMSKPTIRWLESVDSVDGGSSISSQVNGNLKARPARKRVRRAWLPFRQPTQFRLINRPNNIPRDFVGESWTKHSSVSEVGTILGIICFDAQHAASCCNARPLSAAWIGVHPSRRRLKITVDFVDFVEKKQV